MAGTMKYQAALLLPCLGRDEPHVGPADCLADRLGVRGIVLLPLHVGLHVGRRHQTHPMSKRLQLARPIVRCRTGLDTNKTKLQLLKKSQHIASLQLPPDDQLPIAINAMDLKNRLRDIETDCRNRSHVWLL